MKRFLFIIAPFFFYFGSIGQDGVGFNTNGAAPDNSAAMEVYSTDKGLLIPRVSTVSRDTFTTVPNGLMIYNTTDHVFNYYYSGSWIVFPTARISSIEDLDGDTRMETEKNPDEDIIRFSTGQSGSEKEVAQITKEGVDLNYSAGSKYMLSGDMFLSQNKTVASIASGKNAYALLPTATGSNTALGGNVLNGATATATGNTVAGSGSGMGTEGDNNTVFGAGSFSSATTATENTILGASSATSVVDADSNTIVGTGSATSLTTANSIVIGNSAATNQTSAQGSITVGNSISALSATEDSTLNIGNIITADLKTKEVSFNQQYSFPGESGESGELLVLNTSNQLEWSGRTSQQVAGAMADLKPFDLVMATSAGTNITSINYVKVRSFATAEIAYFATNIITAGIATLHFGIYSSAGDSLATATLDIGAGDTGENSVSLPFNVSVTSGETYYLALYCTNSAIVFTEMTDSNNPAQLEAFGGALPDTKSESSTRNQNVWIVAY